MSDAFDLPGGPVFPISIPGVGDNGCPGMSLRDYFAGQAMQAICIATSRGTISDHDRVWFEMLARKAYATADAMLSERERQ